MRLAEFILRDLEAILREWDAFAASVQPAGTSMDSRSLRDHGPQILRAIAEDLQTPQSPGEQDRKSRGRVLIPFGAPHTAAQSHALLRARGGFNIVQMATEYRALRASVLRLWAQAIPHNQDGWAESLEDMTRFNEAIDQALMESVGVFTREIERSRNLFLGVLGHDLRNPLETIHATARFLGSLHNDPVISEAAERLIRSGARMKTMLDDLLDYNKTTLVAGLSIAPSKADLGELCAAEIEDFRSAHNERATNLELDGNLEGCWDTARLQQLLSNLLSNAHAYGDTQAPIRVQAYGVTGGEVQLSVGNRGPAIPEAVLPHLFEPLKRGLVEEKGTHRGTNLGLGLFIAREIAKAHGGDITVRSDEGETVFTVQLPRWVSC